MTTDPHAPMLLLARVVLALGTGGLAVAAQELTGFVTVQVVAGDLGVLHAAAGPDFASTLRDVLPAFREKIDAGPDRPLKRMALAAVDRALALVRLN